MLGWYILGYLILISKSDKCYFKINLTFCYNLSTYAALSYFVINQDFS